MDLMMPDMSGVEATRRVLEACPARPVVALTSFTDEGLVEETLRAGAIGYLMKNVSADQLADAIRAAYAGRSTLAPEAADVLVRAVSAPARSARRSHNASVRCSCSWRRASPMPTSPAASSSASPP